MQKNRVRLISAILFISVYVLSALIWWAFALTKNQERIYEKELEVLLLKQQWATDYVYHHYKRALGENVNLCTLQIDNESFQVDTSDLKLALSAKFPEIYVQFMTLRQQNHVEMRLHILPELLDELKSTLYSKKRAWVLEGITLGIITLLIAVAMFFYVDKIIRLNAQQNNFLLAVTHELKTPIAATKLALQTLQKNTVIERVPKIMGMANTNILRLSGMVEQILLATKFESKYIDPVYADVNLSELIERCITGLELPYQQLELIQKELDDTITAHIDEGMMSIVIRNLITNALKYGDNQKILIRTENSKNSYKICIADLGIGIAESDKKRIFEKFYRVGDEKTRSQPGSGLGLYLVKKITEIHGGRVQIADNHPKGSTFILTFLYNSQNV
jgi:signal transduction histidine kinase